MSTYHSMNFGPVMKYLRTELIRLSQENLAFELQCDQPRISQWENRPKPPSWLYLDLYSKLSGVPISTMVKLAEQQAREGHFNV